MHSARTFAERTICSDVPPVGVLVTAAGPQMRDVLHELSLPTFRRYAERWGYAVRAVDLPADGVGAQPAAQRAKWEKIRLLRAALAEFPLAVWLDADVLLLRDDDDIAGHLHPTHFQALALEQVPAEHRTNPNTGVWLMRSHRRAFQFLDAVEAAGPQPGPWADQGAVLAALGWNRGDERYRWAGPGRGSRFLAGTSWLPAGWNQPYVTGRVDADLYNGSASSYIDRPQVAHPYALHFMGMTPQARHRHMSSVAARTRADSSCNGVAPAALAQAEDSVSG
jgi:galactosyl transferase GMA12/MNN10 family